MIIDIPQDFVQQELAKIREQMSKTIDLLCNIKEFEIKLINELDRQHKVIDTIYRMMSNWQKNQEKEEK